MPRVKFKLAPGAKLPTYGSPDAIGLDLYANVPGEVYQFTVIQPGERAVIKTGASIAIPEGYYGRIAPRSGWAVEYGIDVLAGVVDPDYRGEIGVVLINHGEHLFRVDHGDRVAQIIFECADRLVPVSVDELPETERGVAGFGSTG